jgi:hypothetical protein
MDRRDFYYAQKVTQANMDEAFDLVEAAEFTIKKDMFAGANGFLAAPVTVAQEGAGTTRVDVGTGLGWDKFGQRVENPNASQFVDFTGDDDPTNPRIAAIYLQFARALSGGTTDGLGNPISYNRDESFALVKVLGTPAGSPTPPAHDPAQGLRLAHVTIPAAGGVITSAEIDTSVQNYKSDFPAARLRDFNGLAIAGYSANVKIVTTGASTPTDTIDVESAVAANGGLTPDLLMSVRNAALDLTVTGVGGRDTGALADGEWYIYLIGDSTGMAADNVIASLDPGPGYGGSGPTLPVTHDRYRLIGVLIRSGGTIIPFRQINGVTIFDDYLLANVFAFGPDPHTGAAPTPFISLNLAPFCPVIAERVTLAMRGVTSGAIVPNYHFRSGGGPTLPNYTNVFAGGVASVATTHDSVVHMTLHASATQTVDWRRDQAAGASDIEISVAGFTSEFHHF